VLNENGYKRKTYDDLLSEMQYKAKELFGEQTNVSQRSVIGILLRIMAWFLSLVWKDNEDVYFSAHKNAATGNNLDRLLPYAGITRNLAQNAEGVIDITGSANYTVPAGFQVATDTDVFFETIEDISLDSSGYGSGEIRALESGTKGNVAAHTIVNIVNPNANVTSINNSSPTTGGREKETDKELRDRWDISIEGLGKATTPSIRSKLLKIPKVRAATVIENYTETADSDGRPKKSFQAYVLGGSNQEIGETIFDNKAGGIRPYGDIEVDVTDIAGYPHKVYFSRAVEKSVYVNVTVTKNNAFPVDGDDQIKAAVVRYVGGEGQSGALFAGLNMGEDVIYSKLFSIIYQVAGLEDVNIELSTDGTNYSAGNLPISIEEVAQTDYDYIQVTHNV